ncbi:GH22536 [Drosophila grimshawi]|uniref:GH22536 n=1 Tax=Drosophila grimshawi TaxID=7222 RepID=B4JSJ9_DROGR|nr:GH22536 [Drosophila grimshawi]
MQQQQQMPNSGSHTPVLTPSAASVGSSSCSTPIRIGSERKLAGSGGGGDSLLPPPSNTISVSSCSHSMPGTPQSSSVPTATGSTLQLQATTSSSAALTMAASNQSLGVGASSSISGINITPPNSAGLRQQPSGESNWISIIAQICFSMSLFCLFLFLLLYFLLSTAKKKKSSSQFLCARSYLSLRDYSFPFRSTTQIHADICIYVCMYIYVCYLRTC